MTEQEERPDVRYITPSRHFKLQKQCMYCESEKEEERYYKWKKVK